MDSIWALHSHLFEGHLNHLRVKFIPHFPFSPQVVYGAPGSRLIDQAVEPRELVESRGALRLNATYYITKQVDKADVRLELYPHTFNVIPQNQVPSTSANRALGMNYAILITHLYVEEEHARHAPL